MAEKPGFSWPAVAALATIIVALIGLGALQVHLSNGINARIDTLHSTVSADLRDLRGELRSQVSGVREELRSQVSETRKEVADFRREIIAMRLEDVNASRRADEALNQELNAYRDAVNALRLEVSTKPQQE